MRWTFCAMCTTISHNISKDNNIITGKYEIVQYTQIIQHTRTGLFGTARTYVGNYATICRYKRYVKLMTVSIIQ